MDTMRLQIAGATAATIHNLFEKTAAPIDDPEGWGKVFSQYQDLGTQDVDALRNTYNNWFYNPVQTGAPGAAPALWGGAGGLAGGALGGMLGGGKGAAIGAVGGGLLGVLAEQLFGDSSRVQEAYDWISKRFATWAAEHQGKGMLRNIASSMGSNMSPEQVRRELVNTRWQGEADQWLKKELAQNASEQRVPSPEDIRARVSRMAQGARESMAHQGEAWKGQPPLVQSFRDGGGRVMNQLADYGQGMMRGMEEFKRRGIGLMGRVGEGFSAAGRKMQDRAAKTR